MFPNISRIKGNQTIKFGQLIECNMRNIFAEKMWEQPSPIHKMWEKPSPRTFSEKLKLSIFLDQ